MNGEKNSGKKNHKHMSKKKKQFVVSGIFGEAGSDVWESAVKKTPALKKKIEQAGGFELFRFFNTKAEAEAYLLGIEDMDGWMGWMTTGKEDHQKVFGSVERRNEEFIWVTTES
jgi:hypothetical protein